MQICVTSTRSRFNRAGGSALAAVALGWLIASLGTLAAASDEVAARQAEYEAKIAPFLKTYCGDCHGPDYAEADVDLSSFKTIESLVENRAKWNQVRGLLKLGAMPPADHEPLPPVDERLVVADWIDHTINYVDCGVVDDPGRVTIRRLNATEYDNTVRDLLAISFKPSYMAGFPADEVGNGFDNQSDVLSLPPLLLEKYLSAAEEIATRAIVTDPEALYEQKIREQSIMVGETCSTSFLFADGEYRLLCELRFSNQASEPVEAEMLLDGRVVRRFNAERRDQVIDQKIEVSAGPHTVAIHFAHDADEKDRAQNDRRLRIKMLGMRGPRDGQPALPESHRRIIRVSPSDKLSPREAAERNLGPLVSRAFRRPAEPLEVSRLADLVARVVADGESFSAGMSFALQAILVSPHFLFRVEREPAAGDGVIQPLGDYALASRLSYFLWSSMPDQELFDLAARGRLSDPTVLVEQTRRMLSDEKSHALVTNFFSQWLGMAALAEVQPDPSRFPMWNDRLRAAVVRETELFCRAIVAEDRSIVDFLTADFTFVNPRLAELYGVDYEGRDPRDMYRGRLYRSSRDRGERGQTYEDEDRWIRVSLDDSRRGVLTHASVLTMTSNPTETSPVKRGKWILESMLGDPPPPAPPNVPSFDETKKANAKLSLREQLAIHRQSASCSSCHRVMDPIGLGFENFDVLGRWRDEDAGLPIDASGELADGEKFRGSAELVAILATRGDDVARNFTDKLLTYALGRGLRPADRCAVDDIVAAARKDDYRFSTIVTAIVTSTPFRMRKDQGAAP